MQRECNIRIGIAIVLAGVGTLIAAAKSPTPTGAPPAELPHTPAALGAIHVCEQQFKDADEACIRAKRDATTQMIQKLESVKRDVMKSGALDEANLIQAAIDDAKTRPVTDSTDAAQRESLRAHLLGTKWEWVEPKANLKDPWFTLDVDGGVHAGWNKKVGVWAVMSDKLVVAQIWGNGNNSFLVFAADLMTAKADGHVTIKRIP